MPEQDRATLVGLIETLDPGAEPDLESAYRRRWRGALRNWTPERSKPSHGKTSARNCSDRAMKVRFHPAARAELKRARAWYEERSPMSAAALAQEVDQAISQIAGSTDAVSSSRTWNEAPRSPAVSLQHLLPSRHSRDRYRLGSSSQAEARLLAATLRDGLTKR